MNRFPFIRRIAPLFAVSFMVTAGSAETLPLLIGTGGNANGKGQGIYATTFDPETGKFGKLTLAAKYKDPGFLILHPTKPIVYAVGSPRSAFPDGTSSLAAFRIEAPDKLTFLKEISTGGNEACHLAISPSASAIAIANYGDGRISTVKLDEDGLPTEIVSRITNAGSGPNQDRQQSPHAHGTYFDHLNRLLVPDLGADRVWVYDFDSVTGKLSNETSFPTAPGAGPRHLSLSPDKRHVYVINELNDSIEVLGMEEKAFRPIEIARTLPSGWSGTNYPSEIEISTDGRYVYGSNRGHQSLAVFQRDRDSGKLTPIQYAPCGGDFPRHFKIAPDGKWLISAHQKDDTLTALSLDPATGKLGAPGDPLACPMPLCVLFLPAK